MQRQFISYPKSGRSWVRFALTALGRAKYVAFHHDRFEFNDGSKPAHDFSLDRRRQRYSGDCKIIYLERNPRDIVTSLFFQVTGRFEDFFNYRGTISEFIRDDYFGAHNLKKFQNQWQQLSNEGLAYRISYEQCHADFALVLADILNYYEMPVSPEAIAKASKMAEFENMKKVEQSGTFPQPWLRPRNDSPKVRRGKAGGYVDYLTDNDIAFLDEVFGPYANE